MRKILLVKMAILAACLSVRASGPSVAITTSFPKSGNTAVTYKATPSGSFTVTTEFNPDDKDEIIINGPQFHWMISPVENVSFTPTDQATVEVSLADNAFGKSYDVSVIVTWIVWDKIILDFRTITATGSMTLVAFKVTIDTVEGADYIDKIEGRSGTTEYYATSRKDGEAVIIKLKTVPSVDYSFVPAVTWSGGEPRADPLQRKVSKSILCEQGVFVMASIGSTTIFIGKVYVFRAKPEATEVLIEKAELQNNELCSEADFGITIFNLATFPDTEYEIYYEAGYWKFVFKKAAYNLGWGVKNWGRRDLPESEVNAYPFPLGTNCPTHATETQKKECAKDDLNPNKGDKPGKPKREHYWSSALSTRHEKFHMKDYHEGFYMVQMKLAENVFESDNNEDKVNIGTLAPNEQLSSKKLQMDRQIPAYADKAESAFKAGDRHETAAYGDGKSSYQELVDSIHP